MTCCRSVSDLRVVSDSEITRYNVRALCIKVVTRVARKSERKIGVLQSYLDGNIPAYVLGRYGVKDTDRESIEMKIRELQFKIAQERNSATPRIENT
jgi:hypothetical protein